MSRVAVTSRSFSGHDILRTELLERYPDTTFNDTGRSLSDIELIDFLKNQEKVIVGLDQLNDAVFAKLPELKVVAKYGVGFDALDLDAMIRRKIKLGWVGGVNKRSVSELVLAFAIMFLRQIPTANQLIRDGNWVQPRGRLLSEKTVGIIGCGHVGKDVALLLQGFGCRILAHDILEFSEFYQKNNVEPVDLETLLSHSDIITLHLPLDDSTRNIMNNERLGLLKSDAILINAARGGLVDEQALADMLNNNKIAGAAFDVFAIEPPTNNALLKAPNFIATPHIGGSAEEAILAMGRAAIDGLDHARVPDEQWPPRH